jgi:hypothetical protein
MLIPPPGPEPEWFTTFAVDAMFYSASRKARERAEIARKAIARAEKKIFLRRDRMDRVKERAEDMGTSSSTISGRIHYTARTSNSLSLSES